MSNPQTRLREADRSTTPTRLRVEDESDQFPTIGLVTIAQEDVTSLSVRAQVVAVNAAIDLDDEEALFVYEALGAYLQSRRLRCQACGLTKCHCPACGAPCTIACGHDEQSEVNGP